MSKIRVYDLEGNFLEDFESIQIVSEKLKLKESNILQALKNISNRVGSFQFRYVDKKCLRSIGNVLNINGAKEKVKVGKYWKDKLICVYNSIKEAENNNDLHKGTVSRLLSGGSKTVNGFVFKKIE